jgi:hypothetical protein
MAKPKKKKAVQRKPAASRTAEKPQKPPDTTAPAAPNTPARPLSNLNQKAPTLNYRIAGTPILPGSGKK